MLAGAVTIGIVSPTIVTVWVAVLVFPLSSVAVHVNVVEPRGNTAGASLETITGPKISEAVAVP